MKVKNRRATDGFRYIKLTDEVPFLPQESRSLR